MLKHFLVGITLLMSLLKTSAAAEFSVVRQYVYPIVITSNTSTTVLSSGSGIVIQDGYVLTVAHIVPQKNQVAYVNKGGLKPARLVKIDIVNDLALFAVDIQCPCAQISNSSQVVIDSQAYAVGFPLFLDYQLQLLTTGFIQGINNNNLITNTVTAPGGSGGGVFTKENNVYRLIGVIKGVAVIDIGPGAMQIGQLQGWFVISTRATTIRTFLSGTSIVLK